MASLRIHNGELHLNLTRDDTHLWAHKRGASWPCSVIAGRRAYVRLHRVGDSLDMTEYSDSCRDVPAHELRAITDDFVKKLAGDLLSR